MQTPLRQERHFNTNSLEVAFWNTAIPLLRTLQPLCSLQPLFSLQPMKRHSRRRAFQQLQPSWASLPALNQRAVPATGLPCRSFHLAALSGLSVFVFLMAIWLGLALLSGLSSLQPWRSLPSEAEPHSDRPALSTQQATLVVLVNDLGAEDPSLQGIWKIITGENLPEWTIAPLYPAMLKGAPARDESLARAFSLGENGSLDGEFVVLLEELPLEWNNIVILDQFALERLIDLSGGVRVGQGKLDGAQAVAQIPEFSQNSRNSRELQAILIQDICRRSIALFRDFEPGRVLEDLSGHFITDHSVTSWGVTWYQLRDYGRGLVCNLPFQEKAHAAMRP